MDASDEVKLNSDIELYTEAKLEHDFFEFLKLNGESIEDLKLEEYETYIDEEHEGEEVEKSESESESESEEEFSFMSGGENAQPIAAEDAFNGGQIKTVFPLFNRNLLFSGGDGDSDSDSFHENLPIRPLVKKVFIETNENDNQTTSSAAGNDEISGPYCEWSSRKAVEASPEACKKSSSTGFSKIWRFKEYRERSHSDGRDAFVFLHTPPAAKKQAAVTAAEKSEKTEMVAKVKKSGKSKTASAHEVYLRSKAKDDRRRSYLPYRPELMGFFTSASGGGLTRNVHPY